MLLATESATNSLVMTPATLSGRGPPRSYDGAEQGVEAQRERGGRVVRWE